MATSPSTIGRAAPAENTWSVRWALRALTILAKHSTVTPQPLSFFSFPGDKLLHTRRQFKGAFTAAVVFVTSWRMYVSYIRGINICPH